MPEFVFHWVVLGEVYYDLGLERPHRYGAQQQPFPDGEYGCLFHARSLERPFSVYSALTTTLCGKGHVPAL